jgi:uncharacterized protein YndB with AHSA1/START domain
MSAKIIVGDADPVVCVERLLVDPPEAVWSALTERAELSAWFPCDVEVEGGAWSVGAKIVFRFPPEQIDMTLEGVVLEVVPLHRLSYSWGDELLTFELEAVDDGTRLTVKDALPGNRAARNAAGWDLCLARLAKDTTALEWRPRFDRYVAQFSPQLGPQEGPPGGHRES